MFYVYVIKSIEGFHYTGMTENLSKRLAEHNDKTLSFWVKRSTQWCLVYFEEYEKKSEALKIEKYLKSGAGRRFLKNDIKFYTKFLITVINLTNLMAN